MHDELRHKYSLPKDFKEAWIKALKSGNYKQGAGALRRENEQLIPQTEYCCLGVACSVAGVPEEYISGEWIDSQDLFTSGGYKYDKVPKALHGEADNNDLVNVLSTMNDSYDKVDIEKDTTEGHEFSFEDIADWIDENIEGIDGDS